MDKKMPDDFKKLPEERKIKMQATPMLASVHWVFEDDSDEDIEGWFKEFNQLDLAIRYGLGDDRVTQVVLNFAKKYNVYSKEYIGELSRMVREVYTRAIKEEEIKRRMIDKLNIQTGVTEVAINDFKQIISLVKEIGTRRKKEDEKEEAEQYEQLSVKEISETYPMAFEQIITSKPIKLEIYQRSVRPSVKNWLEDYREKMGTASHTLMQRNHYLFDTGNARKLSAQERQNLADLIESYDEGRKLLVNKNKEKIEFKKNNLLEENIAMDRQQVQFEMNAEKDTDKKQDYSSEINKEKNKEEKDNKIDLRNVQKENDSRDKNSQRVKKESKKRNILDLSDY